MRTEHSNQSSRNDNGYKERKGLKGRALAKFVVGVIWVILAFFVTAAALEGLLAFKWDVVKARQQAFLKQKANAAQPVFSRISKAYHPFAVQHINPYYLFFFPFDKEQRTSINNSVCSIGPKGFRGPSPEEVGDRKLAFIVGGSAVFGHYASSDSTTITGYLNMLQSEYLFVNAGVPSWNSLQELYRLAFQILDYHPDLVIAYDGGNDIALTCMYWEDGLDYPAGTPESFDKLHALVEDIRDKENHRAWYSVLFPRLSSSVRGHYSIWLSKKNPRKAENGEQIPDEIIKDSSTRFLSNLKHMQAMTNATGGRFIAVFQPIGQLHENAPADRKANPIAPYMGLFRDEAFLSPNLLKEHLDYSTIFEDYDGTLPWLDEPEYPDLADNPIFVDGFHLWDRGNRMVAERLLAYLNSQPQEE